MQISSAQASASNPHNDIEWTANLWLCDLFDHRLLFIMVQTYCFHMYSSIFRSSVPTKREPGKPQLRKKSPVARHNATFTSLPARINALLRRLARATSALDIFEPSLLTISGMSRSIGRPAREGCSREAR